jgi:pimeloyl-ACP methyl ester carboxylesterase
MDVAVHSTNSGKVIINFPGYGATLDGEDPKWDRRHPLRYREIAEALQAAGVGTVVRAANHHAEYFRYEEQVVNDLRAIVKHALSRAGAICGSPEPILYLMGFSAGASAVAVLAAECRAERVLLVAPSGDAGPEQIMRAFGQYCGQVYIVVGEKDEVVSPDAAALFDELSPRAAKKKVVIVPGCDHFFSSPDHDHLFRKAAFWAFSDDPVHRDALGPERPPNL